MGIFLYIEYIGDCTMELSKKASLRNCNFGESWNPTKVLKEDDIWELARFLASWVIK